MRDPNLIAFAFGSIVGILASAKAERPIVRFGIGFVAIYVTVIAIANVTR